MFSYFFLEFELQLLKFELNITIIESLKIRPSFNVPNVYLPLEIILFGILLTYIY